MVVLADEISRDAGGVVGLQDRQPRDGRQLTVALDLRRPPGREDESLIPLPELSIVTISAGVSIGAAGRESQRQIVAEGICQAESGLMVVMILLISAPATHLMRGLSGFEEPSALSPATGRAAALNITAYESRLDQAAACPCALPVFLLSCPICPLPSADPTARRSAASCQARPRQSSYSARAPVSSLAAVVATAQDQGPTAKPFSVGVRRFAFDPDRIEVNQDDLVKIALHTETSRTACDRRVPHREARRPRPSGDLRVPGRPARYLPLLLQPPDRGRLPADARRARRPATASVDAALRRRGPRGGLAHAPPGVAHAGPLALFGALAVGWTWPLVLHLGDAIPGDPGDNYSFLWNLWWMRHVLATPDLPYFHTTYLFYPFGTTIADHPHCALPALRSGDGAEAALDRRRAEPAARVLLFANMAAMYALVWTILSPAMKTESARNRGHDTPARSAAPRRGAAARRFSPHDLRPVAIPCGASARSFRSGCGVGAAGVRAGAETGCDRVQPRGDGGRPGHRGDRVHRLLLRRLSVPLHDRLPDGLGRFECRWRAAPAPRR